MKNQAPRNAPEPTCCRRCSIMRACINMPCRRICDIRSGSGDSGEDIQHRPAKRSSATSHLCDVSRGSLAQFLTGNVAGTSQPDHLFHVFKRRFLEATVVDRHSPNRNTKSHHCTTPPVHARMDSRTPAPFPRCTYRSSRSTGRTHFRLPGHTPRRGHDNNGFEVPKNKRTETMQYLSRRQVHGHEAVLHAQRAQRRKQRVQCQEEHKRDAVSLEDAMYDEAAKG